ncbi:putative nucleotidyltransferase-like protein [Motilibacter peucedani]|uniref:Putative nucleotidyltransferase-like protein n=1 Tax=Motilibacter peucedani TaxID=598650 RepID=A0A420XLJ3_9ACTN|nr:nucleotidyltransferase [Motilibacter peucedani]RKS71387.1 putative nucleotidyltransferase-like protein [Motilibacter peucedani]
MSEVEPDLIETTKLVAVTLKKAGIPFALAGGYAVYARGGPPSVHDTDFFLREEDVSRAVAALTEAGLSHEECPEDWLVKVFHDSRLVDLIHQMNGRPVDLEMLERADEVEVGSVRMPVLDASDIVIGKLLAFSAHHCDFAPMLAVSRALREQVDWDRVVSATAASPYARAFLVLTDGLGITDGASGTGTVAAPHLEHVPDTYEETA